MNSLGSRENSFKEFKKCRKKITAIHKASIMKLSDGLFLKSTQNVNRDYPRIHYDELMADNACMQLILNHHRFDVLLLENLYGDIISDLWARRETHFRPRRRRDDH